MDEWEIDKPLGQCWGSGKKIECGEEYFGALVESDEGLQRRDFCEDYWEREKPEVFCYWKSKLPDPGEKKKIFVDDEMLRAFFERLGTETEQEKMNFRFVLTLVLMRKRRAESFPYLILSSGFLLISFVGDWILTISHAIGSMGEGF